MRRNGDRDSAATESEPAADPMTTLRASYTGSPSDWHGAIRDGKRVVWVCSHRHRNRDEGSYTKGPSAISCSQLVLRCVNEPELAPKMIEALQQSGGVLSSGPYPYNPRHDIAWWTEAAEIAAHIRDSP